MLHIILGILKVIGILLGFLLLFLLVLLFVVLFCSVRYQVQAEKQAGRTEGKVKISWLFRVVSVTFSVDHSRRFLLAIRLFGMRLPIPGNKKVRKAQKRKRTKQQRQQRKYRSQKEEAEVVSKSINLTETLISETDDTTETFSLEKKDAIETPISNNSNTPETFVSKIDHTADTFLSKAEDIEDRSEDKKGSLWQKIRDFIKIIYGNIRALIVFLSSLPEKIRQTINGFRRLWSKIGSIVAKPGQTLKLMEELEAREVFGNAAGYVKYLLHHYKPRRIKGFMHFGTGDPMITAYLTGILYLILPAKADDFLVQPTFDEVVFETQIDVRGRIRMCHLVYAAWKAFRDKKLRRIIRYLKKRV